MALNAKCWDELLGGRRAETGMYVCVHEDYEHRLTKQIAQQMHLFNNGK